MRQLGLNLLLAAVALLFVAVVAEAALRFVPALLPHGSYGSSRYDPELRTNVHASTATYNKVRYVVREPNSEGFLDVEHSKRRASEGQVRIAFFGDSYVESMQVPLDQVFHRLLPAHFEELDVETLAFGISGWGTLHSHLAYLAKSDAYDLDVVVYLFVENDPGDNALSIQGAKAGRLTPKAYARLADGPPGFELAWGNPPGDVSPLYRVAKSLQSRFLLGRVLWSRLSLLLRGNVAVQADTADQEMLNRARGDGPPDQNDLPSSWPPAYREEAATLARRILAEFEGESRRRGHRFYVLYVPRGEAQLTGK